MRILCHVAALLLALPAMAQEYSPPPTPTPTPTPIPGSGERSLRKLFLEAGDQPPGLLLKKQLFAAAPDPGDMNFVSCNGIRIGVREWIAENQGATIYRLLDVRFIFTDDESAERYITASWDYLGEGVDEFSTGPEVGDNSKAYGTRVRIPGKPETETARGFMYVFRDRNIVCKLVMQQGSEAGDPLDIWIASRLAQKALARIQAGAPKAEQ